MNIIVLNRDPITLADLIEMISERYPKETIISFTDPMFVIKHGLNHHIDMIFTEVRLSPIDGFTLIRILRERYPLVKVIAVADSEQYKKQAMKVKADGYLQKPLDSEKVKAVIGQIHKRGEYLS